MTESLQASRTMRVAALRMFNLFELYRRTRCAFLVEKGYIPRYRSDAIPDYSWYCINQTIELIDELSNLNNELISFYHMLDESLMPQIFHKYNLNPRRSDDPRINVTNYEATNEFIISGLHLISKKQNLIPLDPYDTDFTFILSNVLNAPLARGENMILVLREHIKILTDTIHRTPIIIFVIFTVTSSILIVTILKVEKDGSIIKMKLFNSLMRIEEREYKESIRNITSFYTRLKEKQLLDSQDFKQHIKHEKRKIEAKKEGYHSAKVFRKGNSRGMNMSALKRIIILTLVLAIVILILGILMAYFHAYTRQSAVQNERLYKNNDMLSKHAILFSEIYEYIGENGTTTIRHKPISTQINADYSAMRDRQSFFAELKDHYPSDSFLSQLLSGNICDALNETISKTPNGNTCSTTSHGAALRGVININAYQLDNLALVKDAFDSSNRTEEAIKEILDMQPLKDAEGIMGIVLKYPFLAIDEIIVQDIEKINHRYFDTTDTLGILLIIICIILLLLSYRFIYVDAVEERTWNKRMLQLIPIKVILNNGHINT